MYCLIFSLLSYKLRESSICVFLDSRGWHCATRDYSYSTSAPLETKSRVELSDRVLELWRIEGWRRTAVGLPRQP
jgi:hypothetical protein